MAEDEKDRQSVSPKAIEQEKEEDMKQKARRPRQPHGSKINKGKSGTKQEKKIESNLSKSASEKKPMIASPRASEDGSLVTADTSVKTRIVMMIRRYYDDTYRNYCMCE